MRTRTSLAAILSASALALLLSLPALPAPASAAPLASLTETAEPTVVTATPQPTATQPPAATPEPTATAVAPTVTAAPPAATAAPPDATAAPPAATAAPEESRHADPAVGVSATPGEARVGDSVTFVVTVTNRGDGDAHDVVVEDNLPGFLELVSAAATRGDVQTTPRGARLFLGRVSPGDEVVMELVTRALAPATAPDNVNLVTLATPSGGDNPVNNQSAAAVIVAGDAPAVAAATGATPEAAAATPEAAAAPAVAVAPASAAAPAARAEPSRLPHTAGVEPWGAGPALLVGLALLGLGTRLTRRRPRK